MPRQAINTGSALNAGDGEALRDAWVKTDGNFVELYNGVVVSATQTTSYTLVLTDAGKRLVINSASPVNVTVPPQSSVSWPADVSLEIMAYGAGAVTLVAGSGVTFRNPFGSAVLRAQYSVASIARIASDEWVLSGDFQ